jgi:hypothetical protein
MTLTVMGDGEADQPGSARPGRFCRAAAGSGKCVIGGVKPSRSTAAKSPWNSTYSMMTPFGTQLAFRGAMLSREIRR